MITDTEMDLRLYRWADWAKGGGAPHKRDPFSKVGTPYKVEAVYRRMMMGEAGHEGSDFPDDIAATDRAVAQLYGAHGKEVRRVIYTRYFGGESYSSGAALLRMNQERYLSLLNQIHRELRWRAAA